MMIRLIGLLVIIGGVLAFFGFQEFRLAQAARPEAQTITCADLEAGKLGDNAHIRLTDFHLLSNYIVTESPKDSQYWDTAWIPAVPEDGEYIRRVNALYAAGKDTTGEKPKDIRVVVKSSTIHNRDDLGSFVKNTELDGIIVNKIESLHSDEKSLLAQNYPGIDFSTCYILDVNRTTSPPSVYFGFMGGGVVLMAIGGLLFLKRRRA